MSMRRQGRGFSLLEILVVITILAIVGTLAADYAATSSNYMKADRAARECVTSIRAARTLAISTGNTCGVRFDTTAKTFQVFSNNTPGTAVSNSMAPGGTYVMNLTTNPEVAGVTMSVSLANDVSSPYDLQYTALGATSNSGTVSFTYGGRTRTVTIPAVGDPTIN
jgi:prepilin-type N-terminal cleavage/methylation domain-containing protein